MDRYHVKISSMYHLGLTWYVVGMYGVCMYLELTGSVAERLPGKQRSGAWIKD